MAPRSYGMNETVIGQKSGEITQSYMHISVVCKPCWILLRCESSPRDSNTSHDLTSRHSELSIANRNLIHSVKGRSLIINKGVFVTHNVWKFIGWD